MSGKAWAWWIVAALLTSVGVGSWAGVWYGVALVLLLLVTFGDVAVAAWANAHRPVTGPVPESGALGVIVDLLESPHRGRCALRVRIEGELWRARVSSTDCVGLMPGGCVRVLSVEGLWLEVAPADTPW